MELPDLIGKTLDQGLASLEDKLCSLNIKINEDGIPSDFYKENPTSGIKRIVRQKVAKKGNLELIVFNFNEIPNPLEGE